VSANIKYLLGTGFLRLAPGEAESGRLGAVALHDALGRPVPLVNLPVATFAVLVAVRLEIARRKERQRRTGPGRVVTVKTVEVPVRLGAGNIWTVAGGGAVFGIGVEPDRPGHTGPWLDPDGLIRCRNVQVRLELHRPEDVRDRPAGPITRGGRR
jgi:hypothetical protein